MVWRKRRKEGLGKGGGSLPAHGDLPLQRDCFLVVWIDVNGAGGVLHGLAAIATFQKNSAEKYVRIDQVGIPEDCRSQGCDGRFLFTTSLIDSSTQKEGFSIRRLKHQYARNLR